MNDLPELPFEKVLSYLSLKDRLKARAVSRRWYHKINNFRVKSLCYSGRAKGIGRGTCRPVGGAFRENFISSSRFVSFFNALRPTILSNLQHLCLCDLRLSEEDAASFGTTLQQFEQLKELNLIRIGAGQKMKLELNLPMVHSIRIEEMMGIQKLLLNAPNLKTVKLWKCHSILKLDFVYVQLFERLAIDQLRHITVKSMKNLQYLITHNYSKIDATLLSSLEQLKEIHLDCLGPHNISEFFEQKQRSGRTELKVYLHGLLLGGPDDPAIDSLVFSFPDCYKRAFPCLTENPSRLADEIPFQSSIFYDQIESIASDPAINLLKRYSDLYSIDVGLVQDIERFLELLKNFDNIGQIWFYGGHKPPQELLDRLPEHCAVQRLSLSHAVADLRFLFKMKYLVDLYLDFSIDEETVRQLFEELPELSEFRLKCKGKNFLIETGHSKRFEVSFGGKKVEAADLNAAIQLVIENGRGKRKAKVLS